MNYKVISINAGKVEQVTYQRKELSTGIYKKPVERRVYVSSLNIEGDQQADLVNHGGYNQAICVYPYDHYKYWEDNTGKELVPGAFGENFTVSGLTEDIACIGDIFQIGEATVQVSQPRQPCFKLGHKFGIAGMPVKVQETGYTGFYFRVLKEGFIEPGQSLKLVEKDPLALSISFINSIKYHDTNNQEGIRKILQSDKLSETWVNVFKARLDS